jgi:hypothetical protein
MSEIKNEVMNFLDELCQKFDGNRKALSDFVEERYQRIRDISVYELNQYLRLTNIDSLLYIERLKADKEYIIRRLRFVDENKDKGRELTGWYGPSCLQEMPFRYWDDKDFLIECIQAYAGSYHLAYKDEKRLRHDDDVIELALKRGHREMHHFPLCTNMAKGYVRCKLNPDYEERLESRIKKKFEDSGMSFVTYYERNILKKTLSKELDKKQAPKRINKI